MAGGEPNSAVDAGTAIPAIPIETKYTYMIYRRSRTEWDANRGQGMHRSKGPVVAPWPAWLEFADTMFQCAIR